MKITRRQYLAISCGAAALLIGGASPLHRVAECTFIERLVQEALEILRAHPSQAELREKFRQILVTNFALDDMAQSVLGRDWANASETDRKEFRDILAKYLIYTYTAQFEQFSGQTISVTGGRVQGDGLVSVESELLDPGHSPVSIEWIVRGALPQTSGAKIVDVVVENVSLRTTYRDTLRGKFFGLGRSVNSLSAAIRMRIPPEYR